MEYDIRDTTANFVHEADPNFEQQMEEQAQELRAISCLDPFYGRWVKAGVEDRDFAAHVPPLAHLTKIDRQQFLRRMEDHLRDCRHCALEYEIERNLNARIENAFQENSHTLLRLLQERTPSSGEPIS
jgi:GTP1/Obg family GTP-binding protein